MSDLLAMVLPLAIGAAVSPTVLTFQLLTLGGKVAALRRGWAVVAGCGLVLLVEAGLGLALAEGTGGEDTSSDARAIVKLAVAGLLVAIGIRNLVAPAKEKPKKEPSPEPRIGRYFGFGLLLMLTNVTTLALYLPAIHELGISDVATGGKLIVFGVVLAIVLIPAYAPPLAVTVVGAPAERALRRLNGFLARHRRVVGAVIAFGFAILLAAQGTSELG